MVELSGHPYLSLQWATVTVITRRLVTTITGGNKTRITVGNKTRPATWPGAFRFPLIRRDVMLPSTAILGAVPWSSSLRRHIVLADGRLLLSDARDMLLSLPDDDQRARKWQRLADVLLAAANTGNAALIAVLTGNIIEELKRPPFSTARLANDDAKRAAGAERAQKDAATQNSEGRAAAMVRGEGCRPRTPRWRSHRQCGHANRPAAPSLE